MLEYSSRNCSVCKWFIFVLNQYIEHTLLQTLLILLFCLQASVNFHADCLYQLHPMYSS